MRWYLSSIPWDFLCIFVQHCNRSSKVYPNTSDSSSYHKETLQTRTTSNKDPPSDKERKLTELSQQQSREVIEWLETSQGEGLQQLNSTTTTNFGDPSENKEHRGEKFNKEAHIIEQKTNQVQATSRPSHLKSSLAVPTLNNILGPASSPPQETIIDIDAKSSGLKHEKNRFNPVLISTETKLILKEPTKERSSLQKDNTSEFNDLAPLFNYKRIYITYIAPSPKQHHQSPYSFTADTANRDLANTVTSNPNNKANHKGNSMSEYKEQYKWKQNGTAPFNINSTVNDQQLCSPLSVLTVKAPQDSHHHNNSDDLTDIASVKSAISPALSSTTSTLSYVTYKSSSLPIFDNNNHSHNYLRESNNHNLAKMATETPDNNLDGGAINSSSGVVDFQNDKTSEYMKQYAWPSNSTNYSANANIENTQYTYHNIDVAPNQHQVVTSPTNDTLILGAAGLSSSVEPRTGQNYHLTRRDMSPTPKQQSERPLYLSTANAKGGSGNGNGQGSGNGNGIETQTSKTHYDLISYHKNNDTLGDCASPHHARSVSEAVTRDNVVSPISASTPSSTSNHNQHDVKGFKTEYKSKFKPFTEYVYNENMDEFAKVTMSQQQQQQPQYLNDDHNVNQQQELFSLDQSNINQYEGAAIEAASLAGGEQEGLYPWYREVVKRNEKANEYRFKSEVGHNSPLFLNGDDHSDGNHINNADIKTLNDASHGSGFNTKESKDQFSTRSTFRFTPRDYKHDNLISQMAKTKQTSNASHLRSATSSSANNEQSTQKRGVVSASAATGIGTGATTTKKSPGRSSQNRISSTNGASRSRSQSSRRPQTSAPSAKNPLISPLKSAHHTPISNNQQSVSKTALRGSERATTRKLVTNNTTLSTANNTSTESPIKQRKPSTTTVASNVKIKPTEHISSSAVVSRNTPVSGARTKVSSTHTTRASRTVGASPKQLGSSTTRATTQPISMTTIKKTPSNSNSTIKETVSTIKNKTARAGSKALVAPLLGKKNSLTSSTPLAKSEHEVKQVNMSDETKPNDVTSSSEKNESNILSSIVTTNDVDAQRNIKNDDGVMDYSERAVVDTSNSQVELLGDDNDSDDKKQLIRQTSIKKEHQLSLASLQSDASDKDIVLKKTGADLESHSTESHEITYNSNKKPILESSQDGDEEDLQSENLKSKKYADQQKEETKAHSNRSSPVESVDSLGANIVDSELPTEKNNFLSANSESEALQEVPHHSDGLGLILNNDGRSKLIDDKNHDDHMKHADADIDYQKYDGSNTGKKSSEDEVGQEEAKVDQINFINNDEHVDNNIVEEKIMTKDTVDSNNVDIMEHDVDNLNTYDLRLNNELNFDDNNLKLSPNNDSGTGEEEYKPALVPNSQQETVVSSTSPDMHDKDIKLGFNRRDSLMNDHEQMSTNNDNNDYSVVVNDGKVLNTEIVNNGEDDGAQASEKNDQQRPLADSEPYHKSQDLLIKSESELNNDVHDNSSEKKLFEPADDLEILEHPDKHHINELPILSALNLRKNDNRFNEDDDEHFSGNKMSSTSKFVDSETSSVNDLDQGSLEKLEGIDNEGFEEIEDIKEGKVERGNQNQTSSSVDEATSSKCIANVEGSPSPEENHLGLNYKKVLDEISEEPMEFIHEQYSDTIIGQEPIGPINVDQPSGSNEHQQLDQKFHQMDTFEITGRRTSEPSKPELLISVTDLLNQEGMSLNEKTVSREEFKNHDYNQYDRVDGIKIDENTISGTNNSFGNHDQQISQRDSIKNTNSNLNEESLGLIHDEIVESEPNEPNNHQKEVDMHVEESSYFDSSLETKDGYDNKRLDGVGQNMENVQQVIEENELAHPDRDSILVPSSQDQRDMPEGCRTSEFSYQKDGDHQVEDLLGSSLDHSDRGVLKFDGPKTIDNDGTQQTVTMFTPYKLNTEIEKFKDGKPEMMHLEESMQSQPEDRNVIEHGEKLDVYHFDDILENVQDEQHSDDSKGKLDERIKDNRSTENDPTELSSDERNEIGCMDEKSDGIVLIDDGAIIDDKLKSLNPYLEQHLAKISSDDKNELNLTGVDTPSGAVNSGSHTRQDDPSESESYQKLYDARKFSETEAASFINAASNFETMEEEADQILENELRNKSRNFDFSQSNPAKDISQFTGLCHKLMASDDSVMTTQSVPQISHTNYTFSRTTSDSDNNEAYEESLVNSKDSESNLNENNFDNDPNFINAQLQRHHESDINSTKPDEVFDDQQHQGYKSEIKVVMSDDQNHFANDGSLLDIDYDNEHNHDLLDVVVNDEAQRSEMLSSDNLEVMKKSSDVVENNNTSTIILQQQQQILLNKEPSTTGELITSNETLKLESQS